MASVLLATPESRLSNICTIDWGSFFTCRLVVVDDVDEPRLVVDTTVVASMPLSSKTPDGGDDGASDCVGLVTADGLLLVVGGETVLETGNEPPVG